MHHSGASFFHVAPASLVWYVPFAGDTVAWRAFTANTEAKSSTMGGGTFDQWAPPSVVRKMVPARPTIQQILSEVAEPASKSATTPVDCQAQVAPESVECSTRPAAPIRHSAEPCGAAMMTPSTPLASGRS